MPDFPASPPFGELAHGYKWSGEAWLETTEVPTPKPALTALDPLSMVVGDPPATLAVYGELFWPNSRIILDGVSVPTVYISPTELHHTVDTERPVGAVPVTVEVEGKWLAPSLQFGFSAQAAPALTSLTPNHAIQGTAALQVRVIGTGMYDSSVVQVDGVAVPSTYVSATELIATITPPAKGSATLSGAVRVVNDTAPSNSLNFAYDTISVTGVIPGTAIMNEPITLTVTGSNFSAGDQITCGGVAFPTTVNSPTSLTATCTPPYGPAPPSNDASWPAPDIPCPVNVTNSRSPNLTLMTIEPRCAIRSMYPDYFSELVPLEYDVEVWCWGLISDRSVVYLDDLATATRCVLNGVGTEYILIFDIEPVLPRDDQYVMIRVLNDGKHWSTNSFTYWIERIGLGKARLRPVKGIS